METIRRWGAIFVLVWLGLPSSWALAAPGPIKPSASKPAAGQSSVPIVLLLVSKEKKAQGVKVVRAMRAQVTDLRVVLQHKWVARLPPRLPDQLALALGAASASDALGTIWVEWTKPGRIYLYVALRSGKRLIVRQVHASDASDPLEALGIILRTALRAVLPDRAAPKPRLQRPSRRRPGSRQPRPPGPETLHRAASPRRSAPLRRLGLRLAYTYEAHSRTAPAVHGGDVALQLHLNRLWTAFLGYQVTSPITVKAAGASTRIWMHPVSLGLAFGWPVGRWRFGGSAVLYLTTLQQKNTVQDDGLTASPPRIDLGLSASVMGEVTFRMQRRLWLSLGLGVRIELLSHRYVVETASASSVVLTPWPVHPCFRVGLVLDML